MRPDPGQSPPFDMEVDYCIVGAGSAGCVVADRLSEDGRATVLVLEAGPRDWHPLIHIPAGFIRLMADPRFNWLYKIEPDIRTGNRTLHLPQGKVLGGTGSINGMLFVRGQRTEYDKWAQLGCHGWSYDEVLPFFKMSESYEDGDEEYRGRSGPLPIRSFRVIHPLTQAFISAAGQHGFSFNPDMNSPDREGVALFQQNRQGRFRASTATTYLARASRRPNVRVKTRAFCQRVLFDGRRAIGVEFRRGSNSLRVRTRREVVLCCGAIRSPHLLQVSGIGAEEHLKALGIPVVSVLPGVGRNLRDHFSVPIVHRVEGLVTINERTRGTRLLFELARFVAGGGLLTLGASNAALFCRSENHLDSPDIQLSFMPGSYQTLGQLEREPGMTIAVWASHPESSGTVLAKSGRSEDSPVIYTNYLEHRHDKAVLVSGMQIARALFAQPALARWSVGEIKPGIHCDNDEQIVDYALKNGSSGIHLVGTCKMGIDPQAVVSPELKVRGVDRLRVIDASVIPLGTSGNTQAPTIMVAEKGSHLIRNEWA